MTGLNYLNELAEKKNAIVPLNLLEQVYRAACALGLSVCGGALVYDDHGDLTSKVLYLS